MIENMADTPFGEDFKYFKEEITQDPDKPFFMANEELAETFFNELEKDYPGSRIFYRDKEQVICMTSESRLELVRILERQNEKKEEGIRKNKKLIEDILKQN